MNRCATCFFETPKDTKGRTLAFHPRTPKVASMIEGVSSYPIIQNRYSIFDIQCSAGHHCSGKQYPITLSSSNPKPSNTSTPKRLNSSTLQITTSPLHHFTTSTYHQINISPPQHIKTSPHQHITTSPITPLSQNNPHQALPDRVHSLQYQTGSHSVWQIHLQQTRSRGDSHRHWHRQKE
jgi:hypothetical protein